MKQLSLLAEAGYLAPIDLELGGLLARRAAASLPEVGEARVIALAGALLSVERGRGNSCLDVRTLAETCPWPRAEGPVMPDVGTLRSILERSRLCGNGDEPSPLVLEGDRLYLYRFHAAERRLAAAVRTRSIANAGAEPTISPETSRLFPLLFDVGAPEPTDWQAVAAAAAMRNRLTVITGGPGTGKTTTAARVLALLLHQDPGLRIALAAPTGKAAARLAEAIGAGAAGLPISGSIRAGLPSVGHTIHRLLGYQPWCDRFANGPDRPLAEDVIVVDEASMVDLLMMDALFAAARPSARIILLGDPDQLASVDTGYVLGDLCRASDGCGDDHGAKLCAWYERLSGQKLPVGGRASPMRDAVVRLRRSYRFEKQVGIGVLAQAIREGDGQRTLDALCDGGHSDVRRRDPVRTCGELLSPIAKQIEAYFDAKDAAESLERLSAFRVLCALREGRSGVAGLNDGMERWLRERYGVPTRARWYDRRPVLITANDRATGLFNGDIGVTLSVGGRALVHFPDGSGGVRAVAPARLPSHDTAWAMTVHKSQGSEFDHVLFVLPDDDNRVLTRELLYTGVTRARRDVDVVGRADIVTAAVARTTLRASGLAARLSS